MEYLQFLALITQIVRTLLRGTVAWAQASAILTEIDKHLTAMQADGNRGPNAEERAWALGVIEQLSAQPAQGA